MSVLAQRIRELRFERKLSIEKAANQLEPSTTGKTWAKWERGREEPNLSNFRALARFFDVSGDYLLGWNDERGSARSGEGAEPGQADAASDAAGEAAVEGDARRADRRQTRTRRGPTSQPGS